MKLSFSLPSSKSSSKSNSIKPSQTFDDSSSKQDLTSKSKHLITEFDPSKPSTLPTSKTLIPPIENQWRPIKRMKNLDLPLTDSHDSDSLTFERDTSSATDQPGSDMSYGLNVRRTNDNNQQSDDVDGNGALLKRRVNVEDTMLKKLKDDLERLPDDQGFDEFKDVPVDGFGAALLAGYGWSEGMGIGKNAKEDVKVVEYKRRTAKEGLGFVGDAPPSKKEKREGKESEKGKKEEKIVRIVGGRDAGLKGSVVSKIGDDYLVLKLLGVGEEVRVKVDDVAELGSAEEERCLKKLKDLKIRQHDEEKRSKSRRARDEEKGSKSRRGSDEEKGSKSRHGRDEVEVKRVNGSGRREGEGKKQVSWLTSHIRVRVISRNFKGGKLYLKKGEVLDVVDPTTCDISMDESREIIQGVSQEYLETALPRRGGPVLVLCGKHKGAFGNLVERDLDREVGVVRDADTHELLNVKLEQIAEYIGDPSLLGH